MKKNSYLLFMILLASCAASNNIQSLNKDILFEEKKLTGLNNKIDSINHERAVKSAAGKIDELTDSVTRVYIQELKDSVNARMDYFNAVVSNKNVHENKKEILTYLNSVKHNYSKELKNVFFLDDLFKAPTFDRLNTTAFFGPGEYQLSDSASVVAGMVLQSVIKDVHHFTVKHTHRKLKAMFIVLGYADEQEFISGSKLYNELAPAISSKPPNRKQLNVELSNRRASSIKNILKKEYGIIFPAHKTDIISSSFLAIGKGEELPSGNFKGMQTADDRRRVVLLYWSILPDLK